MFLGRRCSGFSGLPPRLPHPRVPRTGGKCTFSSICTAADRAVCEAIQGTTWVWPCMHVCSWQDATAPASLAGRVGVMHRTRALQAGRAEFYLGQGRGWEGQELLKDDIDRPLNPSSIKQGNPSRPHRLYPDLHKWLKLVPFIHLFVMRACFTLVSPGPRSRLCSPPQTQGTHFLCPPNTVRQVHAGDPWPSPRVESGAITLTLYPRQEKPGRRVQKQQRVNAGWRRLGQMLGWNRQDLKSVLPLRHQGTLSPDKSGLSAPADDDWSWESQVKFPDLLVSAWLGPFLIETTSPSKASLVYPHGNVCVQAHVCIQMHTSTNGYHAHDKFAGQS